jgi:poly(3-hydroxybutyrate) depolymerase
MASNARCTVLLRQWALSAVLVAAFSSYAVAADYIFADDFSDPGPGPTQSCPTSPDASGFFTLTSSASSYVVRLPVGYDVAHPRPSRLLVALHGCGDTAYNFATWAAAPFALRSKQNYIAISLGGRDGTCWNTGADGAIVAAAIAHVRSCFYVHQERIVLAGYSSGGDLAYKTAMTDALVYSGVLILHSSLSSAVGSGNVDNVLNAAGWKLNVGHKAGTNDLSYPIAGVRNDRDKIIAHGFPMQYSEDASTHDGSSADWDSYLIPLMAKWTLP